MDDRSGGDSGPAPAAPAAESGRSDGTPGGPRTGRRPSPSDGSGAGTNGAAEPPTEPRGIQWRLPSGVLGRAALLSVALLVPVFGGLVVGGLTGAIGIAMGYLATATPAIRVRARSALLLGVPAALCGVVAAGVNGQAVPAACFVALACLLVAPATMVQAGLLAGIPTVAAMFASLPSPPDPRWVGLWMLLGSGIVVAVLTRLRQPHEPEAVPEAIAWLHSGVMALVTGTAIYLLTVYPVAHGYWIAMTLTIVLRPFRRETTLVARERVAGTIGGAMLALALAVLTPPWFALAASVLLFVLLLAYTLTDQYPLAVACSTPFLVLLGAGSSASGAVGVAVERVVTTVVGAVVAGLVALAVARQTRRMETAGAARRSPGPVAPAGPAEAG